MRNLILALIAVVAVGAIAYVGCDGARARVGVASDKVIDKVDDILGKLNVQQKKVQNAYDDLKKSSESLHDSRIEAEVRVKSFMKKREAIEKNREVLMGRLTMLKPMLKEAELSGSIEKNGRTFSLEELKTNADKTLRDLTSNKDQMVKNKTLANAYQKNLNVLKKNDETSKAQLAKLADQIAKINSKKSALDAMKEAASIAGPGVSISDKFDSLSEDVDELLIQVDTEFEIESSKIDDRIAAMDAESDVIDGDLFADEKTDVGGTLNSIDQWLNAEEGSEEK